MASFVNTFGGGHTLAKLRALAEYLEPYNTALKNLPFRRHYIDAFAGTGDCEIKVNGGVERVAGSARIALECNSPFDQYTFIEQSPKAAASLEVLAGLHAGKRVRVLQEDANAAIPRVLSGLTRKDRAVVFLDPFGMNVWWKTLEALAASQLADVWYLFPYSGLFRQAALREGGLDADKRDAITRIVGTPDWETAFYAPPAQMDLPLAAGHAQEKQRVTTADMMLHWFTERMRGLFPYVADPLILRQHRRDGRTGAPLYALYFAVSNPDTRAIALAKRLTSSTFR